MNCCNLLKEVLDYVYSKKPGLENKLDEKLREHCEYYNTKYRNLSSGGEIEHSEIYRGLAFAYTYLPIRSSQLAEILIYKMNCSLLNMSHLSVTSVGCGPGTDLIGILKARLSRNKNSRIAIYMIDREERWKATFDLLCKGNELQQYLEDNIVAPRWIFLDFFDPESWPKNKSNYLRSDLFVISYVITEACKCNEVIPPFFKYIFTNAKQGAKFVFIDNKSQSFNSIYNKLEKLACQCDIDNLKFQDFGESFVFIRQEQKEVLGKYIQEGHLNRSPLFTSNFTYAVGKKI